MADKRNLKEWREREKAGLPQRVRKAKEQAPTSDSIVFSFRCKLSDADRWNAKIAASGYNKSEFFRRAVQENRTTVEQRNTINADQRKILFLLAQLSNNVNQIAHRLNSDHKAGIIKPQTYELLLSELSTLADQAKAFKV